MKKIILFLISLYQVALSPIFGGSCRFSPSCSSYAKDAIQQEGVFKGLLYSIKRISKCHPFCEGGYDPVS